MPHAIRPSATHPIHDGEATANGQADAFGLEVGATKTTYKFIDLFAGLGGFHLALSSLGHHCVLASEIDEELASLYEKNFQIRPQGDIRSIPIDRIPEHDILCAGFPCQNYSKAGDQLGLHCPDLGDLVDYILEILRHRKPRMVLLENVPNLLRHNAGETWQHIRSRLKRAGYAISEERLSPDMFGVPQLRERMFVVGRRDGLGDFAWPKQTPPRDLSIKSVLDKRPAEARYLEPHFVEYLETWQRLIECLPESDQLPSWPMWAMEWGATYPFTDRTPFSYNFRRLSDYKGALGKPLTGLKGDDLAKALPPYAREAADQFPDWKIDFIRKNREFYKKNKKTIDKWLPKISEFAPSFQKLEWNCKDGDRNIWSYVIQFRASGIRIKSPRRAPSLVAMTTSQVPVIAWEKRFMTERECSRLQSMGGLKYLPFGKSSAFRALGNAVNVKVVNAVAEALLQVDDTLLRLARADKLAAGASEAELQDAA